MQSAMSVPRSSAARIISSLTRSQRQFPSTPRHVLPRRAVSTTPRTWQQATASTTPAKPAPAAAKPAATSPAPNAAAKPTPPPTNPTKPAASSGAHTLTSGFADGLSEPPPTNLSTGEQVDWTRSFHGLSATPFTNEQATILQAEIEADDIEVKPDGIIYLPEIKYRRILNKAFGPGGWGLAPRGETIVTGKVVTREYGLVAGGRLISVARGEQIYFDPDGIPTATEGCKSNALMRCCKDLGIASELWDPRFIRKFMKNHAREMIVEHQVTKKRRKHFMRKDDELKYPFKEIPGSAAAKK